MKVNEFIEYMGNNINRTIKNEQIVALAKKQLDVKKYISIKEKKELVDKIIDKCIYYTDGTFSIDGIDCYMYFTMYTIDAYTNLEIDDVEVAFDALSESGLLPIVIGALGQEYQDVNTFLNMKRDEILENNSVEKQFGKFLDGVLYQVDKFSGNLVDVVGKFNIDKDSIMNIIKMFIQQ